MLHFPESIISTSILFSVMKKNWRATPPGNSLTTTSCRSSYQSPFGAAILYAHLGEKKKALDSLEHAYEQRSLAMTELAIEPAFDSIRAEPRFQDLLRRVQVKGVGAE